MTIELTMPALSPTMEKGTLAKWLVAEGDQVKAGDLIAEIETDKATMEYEVAEEGRIAKLVVTEGTDDVPVGTVIALLTTGEMASETLATNVAVPAAAAETDLPRIASATPETPAPAPAPIAAPEPPTEGATQVRKRSSPADRIKISPLAARIVEAKGIDLAGLSGSGPNGRIVRADLRLQPMPSVARRDPQSLAAVPLAAVAPPPAGVPVSTEKLSSMRRIIARRLSESKATVPHFYLTARCNIDPLLALRSQLNATLASSGMKLSVNDMLIKALALALRAVPDANVQFGGDVLHRFGRVDVSMAVAIEGGLVTPVLRDAGTLSLSAIAAQSKALAAKARDGKLAPEDYEGGTVSLSNLGMFGIDEMVPVINPPQAVILGAAAGIEQPWKVDGEIRLATVMAATASFDHRAIDGAVAAEFMRNFKELVESPMRLVV